MRLLFLSLLLISAAIAPALAGPLEDGVAAYTKGDFDNAVRLLRPLAEAGNRVAQEKLGRLYQRGKGVPRDFELAIAWYRKAAEQGDAAAEGRLGFLYRVGAGVPKIPARHEVVSPAAQQGNPLARVGLGYMCLEGLAGSPMSRPPPAGSPGGRPGRRARPARAGHALRLGNGVARTGCRRTNGIRWPASTTANTSRTPPGTRQARPGRAPRRQMPPDSTRRS